MFGLLAQLRTTPDFAARLQSARVYLGLARLACGPGLGAETAADWRARLRAALPWLEALVADSLHQSDQRVQRLLADLHADLVRFCGPA